MLDLRSVLALANGQGFAPPIMADQGGDFAAQPTASPMAAPTAPPPAQDPGISAQDLALPSAHPNMMRRIIGAMAAGGGADAGTVAEYQDPGRRQRALELRVKQARMLWPDDKMAQFMWAQGDGDFTKALAKRYEPQKLAEGETSSPDATKPMKNGRTAVGVTGDYGYSIDAAGKVTFTKKPSPDFKDAEDSRHNRVTEANEQQKTDQTGAKNDADIADAEEKRIEDTVVGEAARNGIETLTPAKLRIFQAWEAKHQRGDGYGAPRPGGESDDAAGATPKATYLPGGAGQATPSGIKAVLGKHIGTGDDGKAEPPKPAPLKDLRKPPPGVKDGQTFTAKGREDGKLHRWGVVNGKTVDLGVAQ